MPTTTNQGFRYPAATDAADGPLAVRNLAEDAERQVVMRFADAADRDTRLPDPQQGMIAWLDDPGRHDLYDGDTWRVLSPAASSSIGVSGLTAPYNIAHRGGRLLGPEHALATYQQALGYTPLIEQDVQLLPDGQTLAVMHDATIDRVTNGRGTVIDMPPHIWKGLVLKGSTIYHNDYPDLPNGCVTLEEVFARFINTGAVFVVEVKPVSNATAAGARLLALIQAWGLGSRVIVQGWSMSILNPFISAGIDTLYLFDNASSGVPSPSTMAADGVRWVGISTDVPDATVQSYANESGLKVVVWSLSKQWERDHYSSLGVDGWFADDPAYLCGDPSKYQRDTDNLAAGLPDVGMTFPGAGAPQYPATPADVTINGHISNYPYDTVQRLSVTHGYLSPLPDSYTIECDWHYSQGDGTTTRWGSVFLATSDRDFTDNNDGTGSPSGLNGYHILFRLNGDIDIYIVTDGIAGSKLVSQNVGALPLDTTFTTTVTVSPSGISAQVNSGTVVTSNDTTYRPLAYLTNHIDTGTATTMKVWLQAVRRTA